ncbi:MAG: lipid-A-disaccharide synthase [Acidobacteriaceae bacterium]|nr:lipid-A-disaccharide synthase [Acidobacteriaceae bacterium]
MQFLVSAGEASGDMYAAEVVSRLSHLYPAARFYGCAGPKLQARGVEPVIDAADISVVGLAEVVSHLPRIYGEYRRLVRVAGKNPPVAALLTDNPDFNLRLARRLKALGIPIYYLVAPQAWAWRPGRVKTIREVVDKLFCLFPFEEPWFRERGVDATYIGHPLAGLVRTQASRPEFFARHGLRADRKTIALLPGSRPGEIVRHLPVLLEAVGLLRRRFALNLLLATPSGFHSHRALTSFREPLEALSIQVVENETWDCIGHADLAFAASGTVTVEAAVLGTPMVTFYKVNSLSWWAGRPLVKVPFLCMVNLIAGRLVVPELMQAEMTPSSLAQAAEALLANPEQSDRMRAELASVRAALTCQGDPLGLAADFIAQSLPAGALEDAGLFNLSGRK